MGRIECGRRLWSQQREQGWGRRGARSQGWGAATPCQGLREALGTEGSIGRRKRMFSE